MCDALSSVIATGFEIGTAPADPMLKVRGERTPEFVRFLIRQCLSRLPDARVQSSGYLSNYNQRC
jgi:hypothetical protein